MDIKTAAEYIRQNQKQTKNRFKVTRNDGSWELLNLGVMDNGTLVEFPKGVRKYGSPVDEAKASGWYSIERVFNKTDARTATRRNLSKVRDMLGASGMWPDLKAHAQRILDLPLPLFDELAKASEDGSYDEARDRICPQDGGFTASEFASMSMPSAIKGIAYLPSDRDAQRSSLRAAMLSQADYSSQWHNRRENQVACRSENGQMKGWYTEERADKTDARRYIILDESHALLDEDGIR